MNNTRRFILLVLIGLGLIDDSFPSSEIIEGYAQINIAQATGSIVVCKIEVNCQAPELLGLSADTGKEIWHAKAEGRITYDMAWDGGSILYAVEGQKLTARNLQTGGLIWDTTLTNEITQDSSPWIKSRIEKKSRVFPLIEQRTIEHHTPIILGRNILLFSSDRFHGKWTLLNLDNRQVIRTGTGMHVGTAGSSVLFEHEPDSIDGQLAVMKDTTINNITSQIQNKSGPLRVHSCCDYDILTSDGNRCLVTLDGFSVSAYQTGTRQIPLRIAIFEEGKGFTSIFQESSLPYQCNWYRWTFAGDYAIRFSGYLDKIGAGTNTIQNPLWIELYDDKGQLRRCLEIPSCYPDYQTFDFVGTTSKGDLLFLHTIFELKSTKSDLYLICMPTLRHVKIGLNASHKQNSRPNVYMRRHSNIIFIAWGDVTLKKMDQDSLQHQLEIFAVDIYASKELWRNRQQVTIHKIGK